MTTFDHNVKFQSMLYSVRNSGLTIGTKKATVEDLVPQMVRAVDQLQESIMGYNTDCPYQRGYQQRDVADYTTLLFTIRELGMLRKLHAEQARQARK